MKDSYRSIQVFISIVSVMTSCWIFSEILQHETFVSSWVMDWRGKTLLLASFLFQVASILYASLQSNLTKIAVFCNCILFAALIAGMLDLGKGHGSIGRLLIPWLY